MRKHAPFINWGGRRAGSGRKKLYVKLTPDGRAIVTKLQRTRYPGWSEEQIVDVALKKLQVYL